MYKFSSKGLGTPPRIKIHPETPDYSPPTTPPLPVPKKMDDGTPVVEETPPARDKDKKKPPKIKQANIEDVLVEVQENDDDEIEKLEKMEKELKKCLGLIAKK